jgi:hypothetical protein
MPLACSSLPHLGFLREDFCVFCASRGKAHPAIATTLELITNPPASNMDPSPAGFPVPTKHKLGAELRLLQNDPPPPAHLVDYTK